MVGGVKSEVDRLKPGLIRSGKTLSFELVQINKYGETYSTVLKITEFTLPTSVEESLRNNS